MSSILTAAISQVALTTCQIMETTTGAVHKLSLEKEHSTILCKALEQGAILYFPQSPVFPNAEDHQFLLTQTQHEAACHKNIAYRPLEQRLTGIHRSSKTDIAELQSVIRRYSEKAGGFLQDLLPHYNGWKWDYATYRPIEEQGRKLRLRARNDLIHVDSFPTRPTFGGRILRFFANIHPHKERVWQTSIPFTELAPRYASKIPLPRSFSREKATWNQAGPITRLFRQFGFRQSQCSEYDSWMMSLHNALKEDSQFQQACPKMRWSFPPGSGWLVLTDMVSHSVLSGQYALEQTVIVPLESMTCPSVAPLHVLESISQQAYS